MVQKLEDEKQLVKQLRGGDEKAWATLFNKYIGRLRREVTIEIINKGLDGLVDPDDVCQEAFVNVFRSTQEITYFYGFLRNAARYVIQNIRRDLGAKKRGPLGGIKSIDEPDVSKKVQQISQRHFVSPDVKVLKTEKSEFIREKLEEVDSFCREMLIFRFYKELNHKDIAKILGISESTSRQRLRRCKKKLKEIMKRDSRYRSIFEE